jgi:hypothetical protein
MTIYIYFFEEWIDLSPVFPAAIERNMCDAALIYVPIDNAYDNSLYPVVYQLNSSSVDAGVTFSTVDNDGANLWF